MKMTRRGFIKTCGIMAGYAVLSVNMTKEVFAAAMNMVGMRQKQVYDADAHVYKIRKSQDNPMIKKIYDTKSGFLHDGPCGHKSHHLLHTEYKDRSARVKALKDKGVTLNI
nr:iron hydrogenase small subunit [Salidesulfovibrio onnuriiensis]